MSTATRTEKMISEPQKNYINALREQREVPADLDGEFDGMDSWTSRNASAVIHLLKALPRKAQAVTTVNVVVVDDDKITEAGMYEHEGTIFQVKLGGSGFLYALELGGFDYHYAKGAMRHLRASDRMTRERAIELSQNRGQCIRCRKTLTDPKSVEQSMGKTCMSKI